MRIAPTRIRRIGLSTGRVQSTSRRVPDVLNEVHTVTVSNRIPAREPPQLGRVNPGPNLVPRARHGVRPVSYSVSRGFGWKHPTTGDPRAPAREGRVSFVKELRVIVIDAGDTTQRDFGQRAVRHGQRSRPCHTQALMPNAVAYATGTHSRLSSSASGRSVAGGWGAPGRRNRRAGCVRSCTSRSLAIETCV